MAILGYLERSGDSRDLRDLNRLSRDEMLWKRAQPSLRERLHESVGALAERLERERKHGVLLQPADGPHDADSLLRPAAHVRNQDERLLLPSGVQQPDDRVN